MTEQKDIDMKEKIKRGLSCELNRQDKLVIHSNYTSTKGKKCSLPSSIASNDTMGIKNKKKHENFSNTQEFDQNRSEMKFCFLDTLANFLVSDVYTDGSVRTDTMNNANKSSVRNMNKSSELDADSTKLDEKKCEIIQAILLEMEIAAIITPSYRVRKGENNNYSEDKKVFCFTDLTEISNSRMSGFQIYINSDDKSSKSGGNNNSNDNNNNISVNNNDNDSHNCNRRNYSNKNNENDDDENENENENENEENRNINLTLDFIRSLKSLNILFKSSLPISDTQQLIFQNITNLRKNSLDDTEDNQYSLHDHRPQNNSNFNDRKWTKKKTKNVKYNITSICLEKEQEKLYQLLSVCFCAIIDSFITFYQENFSKKLISENLEYFDNLFITNPKIKLSLTKISNLFYNHQNQNNIQYLQRNFWSRICSVHHFSDAVSELAFRIISNPHFSRLSSIATSTPDKTLHGNNVENENKNEIGNKNEKKSKMINEKVRIDEDYDLSVTSLSKNSHSTRKRKHNSLPSVLLTPNNTASLLSSTSVSTSTSTSTSTSFPHSSMSSSQDFSFITSLPQIRKANKNGVRDIVVESRSLGNTEFMRTEFVKTEINLTDPLLWEELLDVEVVENRSREGGVRVGGGVNVEEDKRKEGKEKGKGEGEYTLVEDMKKELSETERNHSGKNGRYHPSGKKIKEKKEILESRKLKMNKTSFKDTEDEIRLLEVDDNGFDVQNNDNNVISYVNKNMSCGNNQRVIDNDKNHEICKIDNIQKSDNSNNKNDILLKSKVETFHNSPISNSKTTKLIKTEFNVITKGNKVELSIVNPIPTSIPSTTISEINIKNVLPENILQNNTEAGWSKKDINKKWSISF